MSLEISGSFFHCLERMQRLPKLLAKTRKLLAHLNELLHAENPSIPAIVEAFNEVDILYRIELLAFLNRRVEREKLPNELRTSLAPLLEGAFARVVSMLSASQRVQSVAKTSEFERIAGSLTQLASWLAELDDENCSALFILMTTSRGQLSHYASFALASAWGLDDEIRYRAFKHCSNPEEFIRCMIYRPIDSYRSYLLRTEFEQILRLGERADFAEALTKAAKANLGTNLFAITEKSCLHSSARLVQSVQHEYILFYLALISSSNKVAGSLLCGYVENLPKYIVQVWTRLSEIQRETALPILKSQGAATLAEIFAQANSSPELFESLLPHFPEELQKEALLDYLKVTKVPARALYELILRWKDITQPLLYLKLGGGLGSRDSAQYLRSIPTPIMKHVDAFSLDCLQNVLNDLKSSENFNRGFLALRALCISYPLEVRAMDSLCAVPYTAWAFAINGQRLIGLPSLEKSFSLLAEEQEPKVAVALEILERAQTRGELPDGGASLLQAFLESNKQSIAPATFAAHPKLFKLLASLRTKQAFEVLWAHFCSDVAPEARESIASLLVANQELLSCALEAALVQGNSLPAHVLQLLAGSPGLVESLIKSRLEAFAELNSAELQVAKWLKTEAHLERCLLYLYEEQGSSVSIQLSKSVAQSISKELLLKHKAHVLSLIEFGDDRLVLNLLRIFERFPLATDEEFKESLALKQRASSSNALRQAIKSLL